MTGEILSDKKIISRGSGGKCPEGPHLYKKDGWYYLMIAEGGTEFGHMETIARSKKIDGPYEFRPDGPLLTARGYNSKYIQCTGHADLVDDAAGNWWVVCLGTRPIGPMAHHLGRETFLAPVTWQDGWPYMAHDGVMEMVDDAPLPAAETVQPVSDDHHFDFARLTAFPVDFAWLRNPVMDNYRLNGKLTLVGTAERLSTPNTTPTFVGIRQTQFATDSTAVLTSVAEGCTAGLTAYGIHTHHYDVCVTRRYGKLYAQLRKHLYDMEMIAAELPLPESESITLRITSDRSQYTFSVSTGGAFVTLGTALTIGLATEVTELMTFTGAFIGLLAENGSADFSAFDYTARWEDAPVSRHP
jgi:alpha-N-arabinofuranosidase